MVLYEYFGSNLVDSQMVYYHDFDSIIYIETSISTLKTYILDVVSINKQYQISNITSTKQKCNTGFMCHDTFELMESYKVNGIKKSDGYTFSIDKED